MPRREPERTCIVTREVRPPEALIRFVVDPGGTLVPDLKHKLPGRGAWVSLSAEAVRQAVGRRLFARALKAEVKASPRLADEIDEALVRDLRQALALANKAGAVASGFAKVEAAIAEGRIGALVHAAEAAEDGRRKLAGALRKRLGDAISAVSVVDALTGEELDLALGRSNVIHAAVAAGPGGDGFIARWRRLRSYRGLDADPAASRKEGGQARDSAPPAPDTARDAGA
ncbi:MAG TPA: RNA-binding protein [Beijerinckiaceae bacterium]